MPKFCPICGGRATKKEGEVVWRCSNPKCFAVQVRQLIHFVSRPAFNIEGLGPKIIERLVEEGLIQDAADIFQLKEGDLLCLERFAEKSAKNLIRAINSRKTISLPRFIYALGIRNVGEQTALALADKFENFDRIRRASKEELQAITDIGPIAAESITEWFASKKNQQLLEKLFAAGIKIEPYQKQIGV